MKPLAGLALLLVVVLVSLSAYLRLAHSGIGCTGWPDCYGNIGISEQAGTTTPAQVFEQSSERSMAWATKAHRLIASFLGLIVVVLFVIAIKAKTHRLKLLVVFGLTMYLAMLGLNSGGLHDPAVVMGNLGGGFAMLGLLGWLWFRLSGSAGEAVQSGATTGFLAIVLVALVAQIFLGGLTSANFAASSCTTLPDCHGSWWPGPDLATAMDLGRTHEVTPSGQVVGGGERLAIHKAHRLGAIVAAVLVLLAGVLAIRFGGGSSTVGVVLLVLVVIEFLIGVSAVISGLPIWLAVAHNWVAALLLLAVLRLLSASVRTQKKQQN